MVIAECFHFHRQSQGPEETISEFLEESHHLATHFLFNEFLNDTLRDQLVYGMHSESIQENYSCRDLTLAQAVGIAKGIEATTRDTQ